MQQLPRVLIVGRTNVGKSTLFNRLSEEVKSLAFDREGVTRDFLKDIIEWQERTFELIDTGGITVSRSQDEITEKSRQQVLSLLQTADLILFMCDGTTGVVQEDQLLSKMLHKSGRPVRLVVNKLDAKVAKENIHEFNMLGFKDPIALSAQHGVGVVDLLDGIMLQLPKDTKKIQIDEPACKIAILGKPNVGKSSLLNLLLQQERAIVADIPGTTREAISEKIRFFKEDIQVTDTPGLRRQRGISDDLEQLMVKSALLAVKDADVVILVTDASQGQIADQELKLAFYVFEELKKGLVILFNKQDIADSVLKERLAYDMEAYEYFIKKVERLDISCKTQKNIGKIVPLVRDVARRYTQERVYDGDLTLFFKEALFKKPLYRNGSLLRLYQAKQVSNAPTTIVLYVNDAKGWQATQLGYLENQLRSKVDLKGVPITFIVRKR